MATPAAGLIHDYHEFVTEVGKKIVGTMIDHLHLHIAKQIGSRVLCAALIGQSYTNV
jgi:hypothetical protein